MHETRHPADPPVEPWRKSRLSNPNGNCVELARLTSGNVGVRHSRDPHGPVLVYTGAEIATFLAGVHAGEFDDLLDGHR